MKFYLLLLISFALVSCANVDEKVEFFGKEHCKKFHGDEFEKCLEEL